VKKRNKTFVEYLVSKRVENFIFFMGFIFAIMGYSLWKPLGILLNFTEEESYQIFFVCISVSFFFYTFAYFLTKYYEWRWFPMFVYLVCLSRVVLEATRPEDSQNYDLAEYGMFVLTMFIVFVYYLQYRHRKYKDEEDNDNPYNTD